MNLKEYNDQLLELIDPFIKAQEEYSNFQLELEKKKSHLYQLEEVLGLKNAELRDAYVTGCLSADGYLDKKQEISNNFYRLKYKKDLLIEICKNLRIIEAK